MADLPAPRPLPLVFKRPFVARQREVLGLWLQILWLPITLFGAMLILSFEWSNYGLLFMMLSMAPSLAGRMRHRGGRAPRSLVAAGFVAVAVVSAFWIWFLVSSIRSTDEWWTVVQVHDVMLFLTEVAWTIGASTTIVLAWARPSFRGERE